MSNQKRIVVAAASTALLWGETRVNLGQVRGIGPGLIALNGGTGQAVFGVPASLAGAAATDGGDIVQILAYY